MYLKLYIMICLSFLFASFSTCHAIVNPMGEIQVLDGNFVKINNSSIYDLGQIAVGETSTEIIFTIKNIGYEKLSLTGDPNIIEIIDEHNCFLLDQSQIISELQAGETTSFTLTFNAFELGKKTATVLIKNDGIESPDFTFEVSAEGILAEINVKQDNTDIECGSGIYDFGTIACGNSSGEVQFIIENVGFVDLNLIWYARYIEITGADANCFYVDETNIVSPIKSKDSTNFTIEFKPLDAGLKVATISIANDDSDENPYTFEITGTVTSPEINIVDEQMNDIANETGTFDFGFIQLNTSLSFDFTIQNLGTIDLVLSGNPIIEISGSGISAFSIKSSPTSPIAPSTDSTFSIEFTPTNNQLYTALVSIVNNDPDENPYTFEITGKGKSDEVYFDFNGDGYEDILVSAPLEHNGQNYGSAYIFLGSNNFPDTKYTTDAEVKFIGQSYQSGFADRVETIGDYNGDGFDDILVGDKYYSSETGIAYIFFGSSNPPPLTNAQNADVKINGPMVYSMFGHSLAGIGDFNNDGFSDIIISAPYDKVSYPNGEGMVFVFLGKSNPPSLIYANSADIKIYTNSFDYYYASDVSKAGDVNADGFDDVLIYGSDISPVDTGYRVYLVYGRSIVPSSICLLNVSTPVFKDCGKPSSAGDFNYDGYDDIILHNNSGVSVFFGSDSIPNLNNMTDADVTIFGISKSFGGTKNYVSDINNDGFEDIVLSDRNFPGVPLRAGGVYVILGSKNPAPVINCVSSGIKINGLTQNENFGCSMSGIGDFNRDGINDFIIGAYNYDQNVGRAFIFLGRTNFSSQLDETDADIKLCGTVPGHFGEDLSGGK